MAITFSEIFIPSLAPWEIASIILACSFLTSSLMVPLVSDSSVSGYTILDITSAPGAAIKLAAKRYEAGTPMEIYTAITPPAIHAILPVIEASNSERVIPER